MFQYHFKEPAFVLPLIGSLFESRIVEGRGFDWHMGALSNSYTYPEMRRAVTNSPRNQPRRKISTTDTTTTEGEVSLPEEFTGIDTGSQGLRSYPGCSM